MKTQQLVEKPQTRLGQDQKPRPKRSETSTETSAPVSTTTSSFKPLKSNFVDTIMENPTLNGAITDGLGVCIPAILVEGAMRGVKRFSELTIGYGIYMFSTYMLPLLALPKFMKQSSKEHNLPAQFNNLFEIDYKELVSTDNSGFKQQLIKAEGKNKVEAYLSKSGNQAKVLNDLKKNLLNAKTNTIVKNSFVVSTFGYLTHWIRNVFSEKFMDVKGFTGELSTLDSKQVEANASTYTKYKPLLFLGGLFTSLAGTFFFTNSIKKAVSPNAPKDGMAGFLRKNINSLDVKSETNTGKGLITGNYFSGFWLSNIFMSRSPNENVEHFGKTGFWFPMYLKGDSYFNLKFAEHNNKNYGSDLITVDANNKKRVKSLTELKTSLYTAKRTNNLKAYNTAVNSIEAQRNLFVKSLFTNVLTMGVGVSALSVLFTNLRLKLGFGVKQ